MPSLEQTESCALGVNFKFKALLHYHEKHYLSTYNRFGNFSNKFSPKRVILQVDTRPSFSELPCRQRQGVVDWKTIAHALRQSDGVFIYAKTRLGTIEL